MKLQILTKNSGKDEKQLNPRPLGSKKLPKIEKMAFSQLLCQLDRFCIGF